MIAPLGVAAGPAGALLLPAHPDADAAARVLRGHVADLPPAWSFYAYAVAGDREAALAALGDDALAGYNRFVLTGDPALYAQLRAAFDGDLRCLVDAAAYAHGAVDDEPAGVAVDPVVAAYLVYSRGETERFAPAAAAVAERAPVLAARLFRRDALRRAGDATQTDALLAALERARALLSGTALTIDAADVALQYGLIAHERSDGRRDRLLAAVNAYQRALLGFTKDGPYVEQYALAQMNLGLAYLALPMNDEAERLRPAIALQSLREAASALDPQRSPDLWAGATLNLANALQHARSTHVEDNLWEAVALYEDILPVVAAGDPLRKARVLANQGNALAHLGAFSRAVPRLNEARAHFAFAHDDDATTAIDATLAEIAARAQPAESTHGTP